MNSVNCIVLQTPKQKMCLLQSIVYSGDQAVFFLKTSADAQWQWRAGRGGRGAMAPPVKIF